MKTPNFTMTKADAERVYDVLVETCGADDRPDVYLDRQGCVDYLLRNQDDFSEWRFMGDLGYGGKVKVHHRDIYVSCYAEDDTPERRAMIEKANVALRQIAQEISNRGASYEDESRGLAPEEA